jgi:hypothetical protein
MGLGEREGVDPESSLIRLTVHLGEWRTGWYRSVEGKFGCLEWYVGYSMIVKPNLLFSSRRGGREVRLVRLARSGQPQSQFHGTADTSFQRAPRILYPMS